MKRVALFVLLLASCSRLSGSSDPSLANLIMQIPHDQNGWQIVDQAGGGGAAGGDIQLRIRLKGKSYGEAMQEWRSLMNQKLTSSGFIIKGGGQSAPRGTLTSFSTLVETDRSIGMISVSSASIDASSIVAVVATTQQVKSER
jgi:hypothetical protein